MSIHYSNNLKQTQQPQKVNLQFHYGLVITNMGVTKHSIVNGEMLDGVWLDDEAMISAATNILKSCKENIANNSENMPLQIIPENLLVDNKDFVIWHTPTNMISDQWYNSNSHLKTVNKVPHPKLIFVALKNKRQLYIVATKNDVVRPDLNTEIFHAPFANMYTKMNLCLGSAEYPTLNEINIQNIDQMQNALFFSRYNHFKFNNIKIPDSIAKGQHGAEPSIRFWLSLEHTDSFPDEALVPNAEYKTLNDLLKDLQG